MSNIWSRINTLLLIVVLVAIAGMMAMRVSGGPLDPPGAPASTDAVKLPGTPISDAPFVISQSGNYYVTRDLTYNGSGAAISIGASNVTLDLGGFTIRGADAASSAGVRVTGNQSQYFPISISNGQVWDFDTGIDGFLGSHVRVEGIRAYSNGTGIHVGNHAVVTDCTAANSTSYGVRVGGALGWVRNCMVVDSALAGVLVEGFGNIIEGSAVLRNYASVAPPPNTSFAEGQIRVAAGANGTVIKDTTIRGVDGIPDMHLVINAATFVKNTSFCSLAGNVVPVQVGNTSFCE